MKLNVSYPATGCQKTFEIDDDKKLRVFYDKRMSHEVDASHLGDEWKGYVVRISGGNDKQGFPMKQGVLTTGRVRLLMSKGHSCYRPRRTGERRRKSVRGCIVDANLSVLSLVIIRKGEKEIPGLTDGSVPRRLGPKRASKIRKLFNLTKQDDVRQYVLKRPLPAKEGKKPQTKGPKIQRLVTPVTLQRKRHRLALKRRRAQKQREDQALYHKLMAQRAKERQAEKVARRRSSASRSSTDGGKISVSETKKHPKESVKSVKSAKPESKKQEAAKPSAKAAAGAKPAGKPAGKPAEAKSAGKPAEPKAAAAAKPAAKPAEPKAAAAAKPAAKPAEPKAAGKPAEAKGAGKPADAKKGPTGKK